MPVSVSAAGEAGPSLLKSTATLRYTHIFTFPPYELDPFFFFNVQILPSSSRQCSLSARALQHLV